MKHNTIKHSKDNALEKHEQEALIQLIKTSIKNEETKQKYLVLIHLLMDGGLRISEAIETRLDWFNETEDGITLNIPKSDRDLRNKKQFWSPKSSAGVREIIFINPIIGERVRSFFIGKPKGLDISRQRAGQIIKDLGTKINKPNLHPHALRSTYANSLVYMGVNESTLTYYMGWTNINTAVAYIKTSKFAARTDLLNKCKLK